MVVCARADYRLRHGKQQDHERHGGSHARRGFRGGHNHVMRRRRWRQRRGDDGQGRGDGGAAPDILGAEMGTDDREFKLRAERAGDGTARVYTAKYRATDASGNWSEATAQVIVPHDKSVARPSLTIHRERR